MKSVHHHHHSCIFILLLITESTTMVEQVRHPSIKDYTKDILFLRCGTFMLYGLICIFGVCGNVLIVYVVVRSKVMQTITNIFITNLAVSGILMSVVAAPFTLFTLFVDEWTLPEALCKCLPITMAVSVYVSTLTSTAIALDRHFYIVYPFFPRMENGLCCFIIIIVWVLSITISLPLSVYQYKHFDERRNISICSEKWPSKSREVFTLVSFFLQFIIPCVIICVCYWKVSSILQDRCVSKTCSGPISRHREEMEAKRKSRTNKMLIAMITIFVMCWIPINILWITSDILKRYGTQIKDEPYFTLIFSICHMFAMSSADYNVFIYAWMNVNFRTEFLSVLPNIFSQIIRKLGAT